MSNKGNNNPFDKIQQGAGISPGEVYKVADSVKNADFSDEKTVRKLVRQLAKMANKPLSKEKEDMLVKTITNNNMPSDLNSLSQLFKK
ncbi:stage VI sporulation protein F [Ornithinibacillus halotolerans]|uniref:Stage VI sporulation protein F n=1 Tax=Ornithinibacillus halotolerans TaxID=1274357 RepID=A0A916RNW1_9BACI|nr:stage VI sporulation protein F [Ornithinibacillus halotolerans]GGA61237.1 stage VI sporulation protein F [Ornithinibacillus halotolerans]